MWAQATTSAPGSAAGSGASPGSASIDDRVREERRGAGDLRELARELAEGQVQRPLADQPDGGGVPECGRAAVAEGDLVAVGSAKSSASPLRTRADQVPHRRLAVRGAHQVRRSASAARASGRTLEGPQPKRPSAGFSSPGI